MKGYTSLMGWWTMLGEAFILGLWSSLVAVLPDVVSGPLASLLQGISMFLASLLNALGVALGVMILLVLAVLYLLGLIPNPFPWLV